MSKRAARYQRVIPTRADVRASISATEHDREARHYVGRKAVSR